MLITWKLLRYISNIIDCKVQFTIRLRQQHSVHIAKLQYRMALVAPNTWGTSCLEMITMDIDSFPTIAITRVVCYMSYMYMTYVMQNFNPL